MNKLYNNRFIFIVSLSIVFIMVLAFGSIALTKKNLTEFGDDGYIISFNKVLEFNSGTTYRLNLNEKIVFTTNDGKISEVDQNSFIHYADGSIALLKNGAFVDLNGISESIVPYYNITNKSVIEYDDGGYTIKNGEDNLYFEDILLRVSDDKYLIAGKDLSIKVPGVDGLIDGNYFELTFIEDGIILIENNKDSYQVTADGTLIYVKDKTIIDLGTKNVLYDGESMLSMTQVTIDGNENITITPEVSESDNEVESSLNEPNSGNGNENGNENGDSNGNGSIESGTVESGNEGSGQGTNEQPTSDDEVSVELVKLMVDVKSVTAICQVNNPLKMVGDLEIVITDTSTNEEIIPTFNMTTTGYLSIYTDQLNSDKTYMLTIRESNGSKNDIEYLQRLFTTDSFGVNLNKIMISDTELLYEMSFTEESSVQEATVELYDKDNNLVENSAKTVTPSNNTIDYINLDSNSTYTIRVKSFKIGNVNYMSSNGYMSKTVKTLKQKPEVKSVKVSSNDDGTVFNLSIDGINDPDSSITKYTYLIYKDTDLDNIIYETTITTPNLNLSIGENNIEANTNYRFRAIIEYNDNEKVREIQTGYSSKFISTGATVSFILDQENTTFNTITGSIVLQDPDCTIPMEGREFCDGPNSFSVSYYVNGIRRFKNVTFEPTENENEFKVSNFSIDGLSANTQYTMELIGDIVEDGVLSSQVIIGNPFSATTADIPSLKVVKKADNLSTEEYPINVTLSLESNSSNNKFIDQVKTMTVTLYALDKSSNKVQIGNIVNLTNDEIKNLLYNKDFQMTNKFFGIENIEELLNTITDDTGWAYVNYMIEFTDAYDVPIAEVTEESNKIAIEDNDVDASISKSFLLEYYSKQKESTTATVKPVLNRELGEDERVEELDGSTVAAYKIDATIYVEDILRQYYGVSGADNTINWDYVFYIYDENSNLIYTSEKKKTTSHMFFLDDEKIENFRRGNEYCFGFQIVTDDGLFPSEPVIALSEDGTQSIFNPVKENPYIAMATWESTSNTLTYMYKITKDIDDALYGNNIYIYDSGNNLVDTEEITKSDEYQFVTFKNLTPGNIYTIKYNKINTALDEGYSLISKGSFLFDGYYELTSSYTLKYSDSGNQLGIIINDNSLLARSDVLDISIISSNNSKNFVYTRRDLVDCNSSGVNNCILIDYKDMEEFQGANASVKVTAYYENGLIGLNQTGKYFVFKDGANSNYLVVTDTGSVKSNQTYPDGIYTFEYSDSNISIKNNISGYAFRDDLPSANFKLNITTGGVEYSNYGSYNPKVVAETDLTTSDDHFFFTSIIPMVKSASTSNINTVELNLDISSLTKTIVTNEFRGDDYKIYVELYEDDTYSNPITLSDDLDLDNLDATLNYTFTNLKPNHTYYYKVYANILNSSGEYVKTELYDYSVDGVFEINTKTADTYGAEDILSDIDASYTSEFNQDTYMKRKIEITTKLLNTDNFKLLYTVTSEDGSKVFDDKTIEDITETLVSEYDVSDDKFLYGDNGYNLTVTAITLDDNAYTLELYNGDFIPHLKDNEEITELRNPTFSITNRNAYIPSGENKYAISFNVAINDLDYVIQGADYYVKVTDDFGKSYDPEGYQTDGEGYVHLNLLDEINTNLIYKNLDPNSYYSITVKATTYRNNASLEQKLADAMGYDYITTGSEYNLSLGTGTLSVGDNNTLTIDYTGANNLKNITKVIATVRKENALIGTYEYTGDSLKFSNVDGKWKLDMNLDGASSLTNEDAIRVVVRYYANNLSGQEGLVDTVTYANYSE